MPNQTIIGIIFGIFLSITVMLVAVLTTGGLQAHETREQILARVSSGNYNWTTVSTPKGNVGVLIDNAAGVRCYDKNPGRPDTPFSCVKVK